VNSGLNFSILHPQMLVTLVFIDFNSIINHLNCYKQLLIYFNYNLFVIKINFNLDLKLK